VDHDAPNSGCIEELIHLSVVRKNEAFFAEAAIVANADQEAVTRVDPRG